MPVEGTIVHYVAFNHRHLAAIVIGVNAEDPEITGESIDLVVFTNMANVNKITRERRNPCHLFPSH